MAGIGSIKVAPEILVQCLAIMPSAYKIVGSFPSEGAVCLAVWSSEFAYDGIEMICEVTDAGSTRTIRMKPAGGGLKAAA